MSKESFGIMDECYFVPRTEILDWLNNLLNLNLNKIEQLGSGAVYCQVIDVLYPNKISLSKVNWRAKNDYEFVNNLKILQSAFDKIGIKRYVEVEKLARAKYQDNLEFIQWLKRYFDTNGGMRGDGYNADERRGGVQVDFSFADKNVVPKSYNGSGQVIPNSEPFEKKHVSTTSNAVSSIAAYRNENKGSAPKKENIVHSSNKPDNKDKEKIKQLQSKLEQIKLIVQSNSSAGERIEQIEELLDVKSIKQETSNAMEEEREEQEEQHEEEQDEQGQEEII